MTTMIETARLRLRLMTEADAPRLVALNANPNVYRYTGDGAIDETMALDILRMRMFPQYEKHGVGRWACDVRDVQDGADAFIGWCGLRFDVDTGRYDLGYRFFEHEWGKGYATESAAATLAWGRAKFPKATFVGRALTTNTSSIRVLEKIGLVVVGHERDHDGDVVVYG